MNHETASCIGCGKSAVLVVPDGGLPPWLCSACERKGDQRAARRKVAPPEVTSLPAGQSFALTGRFRVYFNRHGAVGRPWCVAPDAGGWEIAVASIGISTIAETVYQPKATPDSEDGRPSAWISVDGYLTVHDSGHASIGSP